MILTLKEAAFLLGMDESNVYYLLYNGDLLGAKVRDVWRIYSDSVRKLYDKRRREDLHYKTFSISDGLPGFDELLARVAANRVQVDSRQANPSVQRGRRVEFPEDRCDCISGQSGYVEDEDKQLLFDFCF